MIFLGIDLAWSPRNRTGLAAVDESGALIAVASAVTDDSIDAWIATWVGDRGPVRVVGIDAPLVVENPTGSRPCEKEIGRAFGRFHAGAYPANRGNPLFDPPRGTVLAERHGWNLDPAGRAPVALEVYPHAAMVGLFGLGRVIGYKARPRRTLVDRIAAFETLLGHLERIEPLRLTASPEYAELARRVRTARRPVDLRVVEDQLDAIVCAHAAWLWARRPGALVVYGDTSQGCIVAPPPPDWPPAR